MKIYDLHCDTISAIYELRKQGKEAELYQNNLHLDIQKLQKGEYGLQTFALFVDKGNTENCFKEAENMVRIFKEEVEKNKEYISQVYTFDDVEKNEKEGKISALLSLEEGAIFEKSFEDLQWFYNQGARIATFTWNHENILGYPNHFGDPMKERPWSTGNENGLKKRGLEVLEQMEHLHMIPDVSHLSDGGFWDVANAAKRPFLATHSNARGAAPDAARNLTDDMIRVLAEKGGIMGLNFCVSFVRERWTPGEPGASMDELIRQMKYIVNVGGEECLGLGSDFDGIEESPQMRNGAGMQNLAEAMERAGMTCKLIERICYGNVKRFLRENL